MSTEGGIKAVIAALIANIGIAVSKFVAFAFTGSSSMLSEAIHSVADSANQVLLLIGNKRANKPADEKHPTMPKSHCVLRYRVRYIFS